MSLFTYLDEFPTLETERLRLRELSDDDVPAAFLLFSDPESMRFIGKPPHTTHDETLAFIRRNQLLFPAEEGIGWAICPRKSDEFIGYVAHWRLMKQHLRSEIGYQLLQARWGKGLMTEAQIDPANTRSRKTLERLGFVQDGLLRESFFFGGEYTDTAVFTLLEREYAPHTFGAPPPEAEEP
jgi:ribosomal-protein-alanine N-acetyltransferase